MKKGESRKGFTIVETSLVLAIAGLIFMMVFIALPALQRSQRDNQRREDMMTLISKVKTYQTNNRGALPTTGDNTMESVVWGTIKNDASIKTTSKTWAGFYKGYLGENFTDPGGENYRLAVMNCDYGESTKPSVDGNCAATWLGNNFYSKDFSDLNATMVVIVQSKCGDRANDTVTAVKTSNPRNVSVLYKPEGAGVYCYNT